MSIKKILETAGRLGIPVVITNDRGETPQVVMPFEDFVSMVGLPGAGPTRPRIREDVEEEDEVAQALADLTFERVQEQMRDSAERLSRSVERPREATDQAFLEESFYMEPLEDSAEGPKSASL